MSRLIKPRRISVLTKPSTNSSTQEAPNLQSVPLSLACHARRSKLNRTQTSEFASSLDKPSLLTFNLVSWASKGIAAIEITIAPDNRACLANSGAAPVPVPPPRPVSKTTISTSSRRVLETPDACLILCSPNGGKAAHPVESSSFPRRIVCASE